MSAATHGHPHPDLPDLAALRGRAIRAVRPPALAGLVARAREVRAVPAAYEEFRRLVALLFSPADGAGILGGEPDNPFVDYEGRCRRFARGFGERWVELYDPDGALDDGDGEGPYGWVGGSALLAPMGPDYEALEQPAQSWADPALLLLVSLVAPDLPGQEARLDALLGEGLLTPAQAGRLDRAAPPLSAIRMALPDRWREFGAALCAWLYRGTENPFLAFGFGEDEGYYPEAEWGAAGGIAPFVGLRREYREALEFHAELAALVAAVRADVAGFADAASARLEGAMARYLAGELPLQPGSAEEALAGLVARLYPEDEDAALRLWSGDAGDTGPSEDGLAAAGDVVDGQVAALYRHLTALGVPLAEGFERTGSPWRLAEEGVVLSQSRYRPPEAHHYEWRWDRLPLLDRTLHLLSGGRVEARRAARFRRDHPSVAALVAALRDPLVGDGARPLPPDASPYPELRPYLAWLRGEPLGDPLLDCWERSVCRVPLTPETVARWAGTAHRADARLAEWGHLLQSLGGEDGEDEPRLVAALTAMADWLGVAVASPAPARLPAGSRTRMPAGAPAGPKRSRDD